MTPLDETATEPTRSVLARLDGTDWHAVAADVAAELASRGVELQTAAGRVPLHADPVPRVVDGAEWDRLAAGLAQRVRALEAFLRDPSAAVEAGVVPADVVESCLYREPGPAPAVVPIGVAGPDLARAADGALVVLEDNLRTPTLMGYALAVSDALRRRLPVPDGVRPALEGLVRALAHVLRAAAPDVHDPVVVVLGDVPTWVRFEPQLLADALGVPLVELDDLTPRGDRLLLPDGRPVDVLWRRTSEERLHGDDGQLNRYGEALLPGLRSGALRVVNPYGTGVADDKRTHRYAEDLVRLHLGEEPLLRSVRTWDLGAELDEVAERLDELVLKPRSGSGGHGVTVMPAVPAARRREVRDAVLAAPAGWVAQELVDLSTCPSLVDGRLAARHVDLRPCVLSDGQDVVVLTGGLTRVALRAGELVVNCAQGGAAKDTWVLDR